VIDVYVITGHVDNAYAYVIGVALTLDGANASAIAFATRNFYSTSDGGHLANKWVIMMDETDARANAKCDLDTANRIEIDKVTVYRTIADRGEKNMPECRIYLKGRAEPLVVVLQDRMSRESVKALLSDNSTDGVYHIPAVGPYDYSTSIRIVDIQAIAWIEGIGK
jgi:hypothetical protein